MMSRHMLSSFVTEWAAWVEDVAPAFVHTDPTGGAMSGVFAESIELHIHLQARWISREGRWYRNPGRP
eukprot:12889488-Prorocentrum_lima.AAC.1